MENCKYLIEKFPKDNITKIVDIKNGVFKLNFSNRTDIDGNAIFVMTSKICGALEKYPNVNFVISLNLGEARFTDKLVFVTLECLCYTIIKDYHRLIEIKMVAETNILSGGIVYSALECLNRGASSIEARCERFLQEFNRDIIYLGHYRKFIKSTEPEDSQIFSKTMGDVSTFLSPFTKDENYCDNIAEVVVELLDNAKEHGLSDCLVDIDVCANYYKRGQSRDVVYSGINISVLNFSQKLLGYGLKEKIINTKEFSSERYIGAKTAYYNHRKGFNSEYREEDFFNICTFQDKISERPDATDTGGTGLTKLIKSLAERSDSHNCYVISGRRGLWFIEDYLTYNKDGWIGFNEENEFINTKPNLNVLCTGNYFFPGVAYYLNFVINQEATE